MAEMSGLYGRLGHYMLLLSLCQSGAAGASWTYTGDHGQEHWSADYPDCGGTAQSPINIKTTNVSHSDSLPAIQPVGYSTPGSAPFTLSNNGHTVQLTLPPSMHLLGLPDNFTAAQLHLHWGSKSHPGGSEHQIDGKVSPAELHIVHYNSGKYSTINDAKSKPDGLAVLGILIETGTKDNPAYGNIFTQLEKVAYADQTTTVPSFNVQELLPNHMDQYYRYQGSLTTPPCFQSVLWTVFYNKVQISASQMERLQTMVYSSTASSPAALLENNFRDPQPLKQRTVYSSFVTQPALSAGQIIGIVFGTFLGLLAVALILFSVIKLIRRRRAETWEEAPGPSEQVEVKPVKA